MGISFSHGGAHWSYKGFDVFKNKLVGSLGYTCSLSVMEKDGTYSRLERETIYPLINHLNYDELLTVKEMEQVLPQLTSIINKWEDEDEDKIPGLLLIAGMIEAIEQDAELEFI